jgi:hypothetical protein
MIGLHLPAVDGGHRSGTAINQGLTEGGRHVNDCGGTECRPR